MIRRPICKKFIKKNTAGLVDTTPAVPIMGKEETSTRKNRVLIIDHDLQTCKDIKYNVDSATTEAYYTLTVREGLAELTGKDYDLVILNVCFPEMDGMELLKALRELKPMPILILSTSSALADKLEAFKTGADDYLTKPFENEECLARIYALLRRFHELNPLKTRAYSIVAHGDLVMKRDTRQALISGRPLELTYREYELLGLFLDHKQQVFTFEQFYEMVWAEPYMGNKNSVVCEMKRLRKKLGDTDPIEAVQEVGYRFKKE